MTTPSTHHAKHNDQVPHQTHDGLWRVCGVMELNRHGRKRGGGVTVVLSLMPRSWCFGLGLGLVFRSRSRSNLDLVLGLDREERAKCARHDTTDTYKTRQDNTSPKKRQRQVGVASQEGDESTQTEIVEDTCVCYTCCVLLCFFFLIQVSNTGDI